MDKIFMKEK